MKDLLLFIPVDDFARGQYEFLPIGALTLASFLISKGYEVDVVHGTTDEIKTGYKYYGISATTAQYTRALKAKKHIKDLEPHAKVILGGAHLNAPQCVLEAKDDQWDYLVVGDGEYPLLNIVSGQENKQIVYGRVTQETVIPAYDKLDLSKYNYPLNKDSKCINLITSRGCPFKCKFCSTSQTPIRYKPIEQVIQEVDLLVNTYGFNSLTFVDDTMSINRKRYYTILEQLKQFNIEWRAYGRTNTINKEGLRRMKEAGCIEICPGVESGSQHILDLIQKGTKVSRNEQFIQECKDAGIKCAPFIIIGLPGESPTTVLETYSFMKRTKPEAFGYNILMPFPDSPIVQEYESTFKKFITIHPYTWDDCITKSKKITKCFVSTPTLNREQIIQEYYKYLDIFSDITGLDPRTRGKDWKDE